MAVAKPQLSRRAILRAPARGAIAMVVVAVAGCGTASEPRAPSQPPADRLRAVPSAVQRYVHATFHGLPRVCSRRHADRPVLDAKTARFIRLYRRYPADRFDMTIDDESGTMLSAILVLRHELATCSPRHAALIDPVLPTRVRGALRALPSTRR